MTGTKSSNAEINVHEVGDLEIFLHSHVTLLFASKHKILAKYQIVQIMSTEVSLNIKIAQFVDADRLLDTSSKNCVESTIVFFFDPAKRYKNTPRSKS